MTTIPQANLGSASSIQLAGGACIVCGAEELPLHPAGTVTVGDATPGVVHDHEVVLCSSCLVVSR